MAYLPADRRFVLVANRFRWEPSPDGASFERILSGLRVDGVRSVQRRGFRLDEPDRILGLLALRGTDGELRLDFSGGGSIRLEVDRILCHLEDLGEPWPTRWRPRHPLDEKPG
jgi:hypothetical protein